MVSQRTRNAVWQNYLDVSGLRSRYGTLANRYLWYSVSLRVALLIAVLGCAASLLAPMSHPAATIALAIAAVVLALADFALNLARKSEVLRQINADLVRLESDWIKLLIRIGDEDADELEFRSENRRLKNRLIDATTRRGERSVAADRSLNRGAYPTMSLGIPGRPSPSPPPPPPPPRPAPKKQG